LACEFASVYSSEIGSSSSGLLRLVPLGWGLEGMLLVEASAASRAAFCVSSSFALVDSSESGSIPLGWGPEGTLVVDSSPAGGSTPE